MRDSMRNQSAIGSAWQSARFGTEKSQVRFLHRRPSLLAIVLLAMACGNGPVGPDPIDPDPSPSPSPSPSSAPPLVAPRFTISGARFNPPLLGFSFCCDDPDTPGLDEGYAAGWPLASRQALSDLRSRSSLINLIHMRSGPFRMEGSAAGRYSRLLGVRPQVASWTTSTTDLRTAVIAANAEGFAVEVDVIDGWGLRHGELIWPDGCSVTRSHPQARHLQWAKDVAAATADLAVTYQIGNEISLCKPSVRWVRGIRDALREGGAIGPIGSDSFPEEVNYETYHGKLSDIRSAGWPVIHNESDNERETADSYIAWLRDLDAAGSYGAIWFGPTALAEREALLRRLQ